MPRCSGGRQEVKGGRDQAASANPCIQQPAWVGGGAVQSPRATICGTWEPPFTQGPEGRALGWVQGGPGGERKGTVLLNLRVIGVAGVRASQVWGQASILGTPHYGRSGPQGCA